MRLPIAALSSWLSPVPPADEVARTLTAIGLEVEGSEETATGTVLEINVTPNRGDCLSVRGLARELCAALGRPYTDPAPAPLPAALANASLPIALPDSRCPRYLGVEIRGVKNGQSPKAAQQMLESFGVRPISLLVDAANLVMLELGQPLHTFDLATLKGGITVRAARAGETLVTLDGQKRELTPWPVKGQSFAPLLICDSEAGARPIALAGVMGGGVTEISERSVDLYLEAATFDPVAVRRTAKKFLLHSEASHRFERAVDPNLPKLAAERFIALVKEWGGGGTVAGWRMTETVAPEKRSVELRPSQLKRLLGAEMPAEFIATRFAALGFKSAGSERWEIPSWRPDLTIEEDLIEEAGRHYGYDNIGETLPAGIDPAPGRTQEQRTAERLRERALQLGFTESISVPFADNSVWPQHEDGSSPISISNPIWLDKPALRDSQLITMLSIGLHNLSPDVLEGEPPTFRLFEICKSYTKTPKDPAPIETVGMVMAIAMPLNTKPEVRSALTKEIVRQMFGVVKCCGSSLGSMTYEYPHRQPHQVSDPAWRHPVEIHYLRIEDLKFGKYLRKSNATMALIVVKDISKLESEHVKVSPLPRFPAIIRDLNLLVPYPAPGAEGIQAEPYLLIKSTAENAGASYLTAVKNVDSGYFGKELPAGQFALAVRFTFRNPDDTLTAEAAEADLAKIRAALDAIGVTVRG